MSPQVQNGAIKSYFEDLESWKAIDDHTVVFRWKKPYYNAIDSTLSLFTFITKKRRVGRISMPKPSRNLPIPLIWHAERHQQSRLLVFATRTSRLRATSVASRLCGPSSGPQKKLR